MRLLSLRRSWTQLCARSGSNSLCHARPGLSPVLNSQRRFHLRALPNETASQLARPGCSMSCNFVSGAATAAGKPMNMEESFLDVYWVERHSSLQNSWHRRPRRQRSQGFSHCGGIVSAAAWSLCQS